ncbi:calreticulin family domain-containing protein [Phthorimaea operculella]|nr:calreticulin family domain-containing protein [Phthorimaea operculella]
MKLLIFAFASLLAVYSVNCEVYFEEKFPDDSWEGEWVYSEHPGKEFGKFKLTAGKFYNDAEEDKGLQTSEDARFYALSKKFKPFSNEGKNMVIQFSVKHEQDIDCGGGYLKIFNCKLDQKDMHGESPYEIMFGPDICGPGTKKVHVIFSYKGKNHLIKKDIRCKDDVYTHVYTLVVKPDNTYEVLIDNEKIEDGELEADWDFLPPRKIKNHLIKKDIRCKDDVYTHVYTLVVKPDNTYEVLIDNEKIEDGELEADWDFLPPRKIKDIRCKDDVYTHVYTLVVKPDNTYEVLIDNEKIEDGELEADWDFLPPRKIKAKVKVRFPGQGMNHLININHLIKKDIRCKDEVYTHVYTLVVKPDNTYEVLIDNEKIEDGELEADWDFLPPRKIKARFPGQGINHLTKKDIRCKDDVYTHVYTLVVKPDNTYEVLIDNEKIEDGELEADWDFLPPRKIKDPEAKKPEDWDDRPTIPDPDDTKPEDWDKPEHIPDPDATKPEDWDDEMDGEWEPPMIDNPDYKGVWAPKQIDNPAYKGPWVHPEIDNPEYTPDASLYKRDEICAVGLDLWQVKSGTIFDNILFTDDLELAKERGEAIKKRLEGEKKMKHEQDEAERAKEKQDKPEDDEDDEDLDDEAGEAVPQDDHDEL